MTRSTIIWAAMAAIGATIAIVIPADAQYTVDTAISDSVPGETGEVDDNPPLSHQISDRQRAFRRE